MQSSSKRWVSFSYSPCNNWTSTHTIQPGSPDPDGRQIDGLGGGVSSLSKVCIVSTPGEGGRSDWPGVKFADDLERSDWDVVYRFGQVAVREASIDW
jgi:2-methylaconitate isomerase